MQDSNFNSMKSKLLPNKVKKLKPKPVNDCTTNLSRLLMSSKHHHNLPRAVFISNYNTVRPSLRISKISLKVTVAPKLSSFANYNRMKRVYVSSTSHPSRYGQNVIYRPRKSCTSSSVAYKNYKLNCAQVISST